MRGVCRRGRQGIPTTARTNRSPSPRLILLHRRRGGVVDEHPVRRGEGVPLRGRKGEEFDSRVRRAAEIELPRHRAACNGELRGKVGGQAGDLRLCKCERVAACARVRRGVSEWRLAVGQQTGQTRDADLIRAAVFVSGGVSEWRLAVGQQTRQTRDADLIRAAVFVSGGVKRQSTWNGSQHPNPLVRRHCEV